MISWKVHVFVSFNRKCSLFMTSKSMVTLLGKRFLTFSSFSKKKKKKILRRLSNE